MGGTITVDLTTPNDNFMEGYLSMKGASGGLFSDPWTRRYFVLHGSDLYYYKSREDFDLDPKKPIKNRPVHING